MKKVNDIFLDMLPSIDLHGYDKDSAVVATNDFIEESIILNHKEIVIIHGIGEGILKHSIHEALKRNKKVLSFNIVSNNPGCTKIIVDVDNFR